MVGIRTLTRARRRYRFVGAGVLAAGVKDIADFDAAIDRACGRPRCRTTTGYSPCASRASPRHVPAEDGRKEGEPGG